MLEGAVGLIETTLETGWFFCYEMIMNKKQKKLYDETKGELKKQVIVFVVLWLIGGVLLLKFQFWLWLLIFVLLLAFGGILVFSARRGIWVPIWRGVGLLYAMGSIGISGLYISFKPELIFNNYSLKILSASLFAVIFIVSIVMFFFYWIKPYWDDTIEINLKYKINLDKGTYSVVTDWATRNIPSGNNKIWIPISVYSGPVIAASIRGTGDIKVTIITLVSFFLVWAAFSMSLIEFYNAYKIRYFEKKSGKPLIIDAYLFEG